MQRIGKQIALTVTEEQQEKVAKIAKRHNLKRAQVYRKMMDLGLGVYDNLEKVGVVKMGEITEKAEKMTKDFVSKKQRKLFT